MQVNLTKTEPDTRIVDETFDPDKAGSYHLFLYGVEDCLSLAILDGSRNTFIALQEYSFGQLVNPEGFCLKLLPILEEEPLLANPSFKSVNFCYGGIKSTLVPDPLFSADEAEKYLAFHFPLASSERVHTDHLKMLGARNVFSVPVAIEKLIHEKFPAASVHHHATSFIESLIQSNKNRDEKIITVFVRLSGFEMAVTRRNELLFYNSFLYQTTEDFLYYVLFTMEQLQLNPESTPFVFTGAADRSSALYITTRKYIREVTFGERTAHCSFSYAFENIPGHFHYNLFNQYLCES